MSRQEAVYKEQMGSLCQAYAKAQASRDCWYRTKAKEHEEESQADLWGGKGSPKRKELACAQLEVPQVIVRCALMTSTGPPWLLPAKGFQF